MENIDPGDLIKNLHPGYAVHAIVRRPERRVDFLVREDSRVIRNRLRNPMVAIRGGVFIESGVGLVVIMFMLGSGKEQLFETYWNYCQPQGEDIFKTIAEQEDLAFHLYGDSGEIEKSVLAQNNLKDFFKQATAKILTLPPWDMAAFDRAKAGFLKSYPDMEKLWDSLFLIGKGN